MEPARLRISKGGLFMTSFTVKGHESVIQKYVNALSGCPVSNRKIRNGTRMELKTTIWKPFKNMKHILPPHDKV